ncbi:MAG: hypothetical protein KAU31_03190, partial [Spirochaetaceae bacterium]|nr:hypothetical protein [Spirochaetaceae bacterium]
RLLVQGGHFAPVPVRFGDYAMHREINIISTWAIGSADEPGIRRIATEAKENLMLSMELLRRGELKVNDLVTHRFSFEHLPEVYAKIDSGNLNYLQVILEY